MKNHLLLVRRCISIVHHNCKSLSEAPGLQQVILSNAHFLFSYEFFIIPITYLDYFQTFHWHFCFTILFLFGIEQQSIHFLVIRIKFHKALRIWWNFAYGEPEMIYIHDVVDRKHNGSEFIASITDLAQKHQPVLVHYSAECTSAFNQH